MKGKTLLSHRFTVMQLLLNAGYQNQLAPPFWKITEVALSLFHCPNTWRCLLGWTFSTYETMFWAFAGKPLKVMEIVNVMVSTSVSIFSKKLCDQFNNIRRTTCFCFYLGFARIWSRVIVCLLLWFKVLYFSEVVSET